MVSSLALIFALDHVKPTPVYVLDEIDAALDFRNVSIVGRYVLERAVGAQFIIISLRNNLFELAHQLIGIHKVHDCTRSTVLNPSAVAEIIMRNSSKHITARPPSQINRAQNKNRSVPSPCVPPARVQAQHRATTDDHSGCNQDGDAPEERDSVRTKRKRSPEMALKNEAM